MRDKNKTRKILEILDEHPYQTFTAAELSKKLSIERPVIVALLKRLSDNNEIIRVAKGKYSSKVTVDREVYKKFYMELIEKSLSSFGESVKFDFGRFDEKQPLESLRTLITTLSKKYGEKFVNGLVKAVLYAKFSDKDAKILYSTLNFQL